jgi:CheY-like chemotaxis protein
VDDNANTRLLLRRMLRDALAVDVVGTAEEALDAAARAAEDGRPYDAVLLDINLGGPTSGEDVMRRLRALPGYACAPLIAFTAYALPGDRERFLHAGFSGYLAKPFTKEHLREVLDALLGGAPAPGRPASEGPPEAPFPLVVAGPGARAADRAGGEGDGAITLAAPDRAD